jgi:anti-anti-sigma factor
MQITSTEEAECLVLKLNGRFDFHSHRDFRTAYEKALDSPRSKTIEVNFEGVDYLDSSALGMLLLFREKADASRKQIMLAGLKGTVKQVLDVANFGKLFTIKS